MRLADLDLPIVNKGWRVWPGLKISLLGTSFRDQWSAVANERKHDKQKRRVIFLGCLFEGLLQVTGKRVPATLSAETFPIYRERFEDFVGALHSEYFYFGQHSSRVNMAFEFRNAIQRLSKKLKVELAWNGDFVGSSVQPFVTRVEAYEIDPLKTLQWQGWPCKLKGSPERLTFAPLNPVLSRLGYEFTSRLYTICQTHAGRGRGDEFLCIRALSQYISEANEAVTVELLRDPVFTETFFCSLFESYLKDGYREGRGMTVARLVTLWRGQITRFFEEMVFPTGLIARPHAGLPSPRCINVRGETTNLTETDDGVVHDKLLTRVPLEVNDDEAMEIIFRRVEGDLEQVKRWAWQEVLRVASLLERRRHLAILGTPRKIVTYDTNCSGSIVGSTSWNHPDHLQNGAATYEAMGYPYPSDGQGLSKVIFPAPKLRWAEELAVPTASTLVAHCAVVIGEHPEVTPALLEQLELYDKNGRLLGVSGLDGGTLLSGAKLRRGAGLANMDIVLNERSAFAIDQICQLTQSLRDWLRLHGRDDSWRYLLLTSGMALGRPHRVKRLASRTSGKTQLSLLAKSFARVLGISPQDARLLADRFSLTAMRASAGVLVYFKTKSVSEMADALGHVKYDVKLMDRYLPKALRQFFEERWIRIFQLGVIVQALEGSRFKLAASGFHSIEELDAFLLNHAIKLPPSNSTIVNASPTTQPISTGREAIFGLNEEILTTLLSLQIAREEGRPLVPRALYWAEVARELVPYVESASATRPDIHEFLIRARARAGSHLVRRYSCAE